MPRTARRHAPGAVVHITARFVNRAFRLSCPDDRAAYLRRIPSALAHGDCTLLAFALMSSHVHLVVLAGSREIGGFVKALHTGFAGWLNHRQGTLGPLFAERYASVLCPPERAALLITYVHNNPVRASVVSDPADSDWTSHRALVGLSPAPPGLDVSRALALCGFDMSPAGRRGFHELARSRSQDPRSAELSGTTLRERRRQIRQVLGAAVELGTPSLAAARGEPARAEIVAHPQAVLRPRWSGTPSHVLEQVAQETAVDVARMRSGDRGYAAVRARALTLLVWTRMLHRPQVEMRETLGMASSSASSLVSRALIRCGGAPEPAAIRIASRCWRDAGLSDDQE